MCLSNEWLWSGGLAQYLVWSGFAEEIPAHPPGPNSWETFMHFTSEAFRHEPTVALYHDHVKTMVSRYVPSLPRSLAISLTPSSQQDKYGQRRGLQGRSRDHGLGAGQRAQVRRMKTRMHMCACAH